MVAFCIGLIIVSLLLLYPILKVSHFDSVSYFGVVCVIGTVFFAILTIITKFSN